jgi:hypothetical protein
LAGKAVVVVVGRNRKMTTDYDNDHDDDKRKKTSSGSFRTESVDVHLETALMDYVVVSEAVVVVVGRNRKTKPPITTTITTTTTKKRLHQILSGRTLVGVHPETALMDHDVVSDAVVLSLVVIEKRNHRLRQRSRRRQRKIDLHRIFPDGIS